MNQLSNGRCQRCQKDTNITSMSIFNTQNCCIECIDIEKYHPSYKWAKAEELRHTKHGNYNFSGIGLPAGYYTWSQDY